MQRNHRPDDALGRIPPLTYLAASHRAHGPTMRGPLDGEAFPLATDQCALATREESVYATGIGIGACITVMGATPPSET